MKIGFPNHPRLDILEEIRWIGENGFDFVDLFLEEDRAVPDRIDAMAIRALLNEYHLGVIGHTAWYLPIGSPSKALREAAISEALRYCGVFESIGVDKVTIHANWIGGTMFSARESAAFQIESLLKLVEASGNFGITIMFEPVDSKRDSVENIAFILESVPGLALHLDLGHANLWGRTPGEYIRQFSHRLAHVHLHDNDGRRDLHLPLGCGRNSWKRSIRELKQYYNGTITLEVFSEEKEYALMNRRMLRHVWDTV